MLGNRKKIAIGSDHAGFILKKYLIKELTTKGFDLQDFGAFSEESVDYPDIAHPLAIAIEENKYDFGILICGSGNGVSIVANKHSKIRAALCWTVELGKLARQHNNANILTLPARFIEPKTALSIVEAFLNTDFEGGRHQKRIDKIS